MSDEIDVTADGVARFMYDMYSVRGGVPWHTLGQPVHGLATAEEAMEKAMLAWLVSLEPAWQQMADGTYRLVPNRFLITRDEDERVLGTVSQRYVPVQNREAFAFVDALVDSDEAKYETAGALYGGRHIFLSAQLPDGATVGGMPTKRHLLFSNPHTGLGAVTVRFVETLVVCANTLSWAFGEAVPVWSFPHVTGIEERLVQARETLQLATAYDNAFNKQAEAMARIDLDLAEMTALLKVALPERLRKDKEVKAVTDNVAGSVTIPDEHRRNGWGLMNGMTEWLQHVRPARSTEGRFHDVIEGESSRSRSRLAKLLLAGK